MAKDIKLAKSEEDFDKKWAGVTVDVQALARDAGFRSTGSLKLDNLLNGGFPKGTMVELWGPPQSSKSTLAQAAAGVCLREGGKVAYIDLERGLDVYGEAAYVSALQNRTESDEAAHVAVRQSWLRKNGIDPTSPNFSILSPEHGEDLFRLLADIIRVNRFDLVIVDSVAAILTRAMIEGDVGEAYYGQVAKLMSSELPRLLRLYDHNPNTNIIWINQARDKIGFKQTGQKSTGGHALFHAVGTKIHFRKIGRVRTTSGDIVTTSKLKVDKSRYASPHEIEIEVSGERGLDVLGELLQFGEEQGYIHGGTWRYFFNAPLSDAEFKSVKGDADNHPEYAGKANGGDNAKLWMQENGWYDKLYDEAVRVGFQQ